MKPSKVKVIVVSDMDSVPRIGIGSSVIFLGAVLGSDPGGRSWVTISSKSYC